MHVRRRLAALQWMLGLCSCLLTTSAAQAQQYTGPGSLPQPSLESGSRSGQTGPALEVVGGSLITLASVPVSLVVFLFKGPPMLGCSFDFIGTHPPDEDCERRREQQREQARRASIWSGLAVGLVGVGLITHGAFRLRRARQRARQELLPTAFGVDAGAGRGSLSLRWQF
ncbi:MAG: hypothetical protein QM778_02445 [Myxococcales bacterium]